MPLDELDRLESLGLRDRVAENLREAIATGRLKPGDPIPEVAVAQRLGVSRGPVREALLILEREGLAVIRPNRGAYVRELSRTEFVEIQSLRQHLETMALELARERITPAELAALRDLYTETLAAAPTGDLRVFTRNDPRFHHLIWTASGHQLLAGTLTRIAAPVFAFGSIRLHRASFDFSPQWEPHTRIIEYLAGGSALSASEAIRGVFVYDFDGEWEERMPGVPPPK